MKGICKNGSIVRMSKAFICMVSEQILIRQGNLPKEEGMESQHEVTWKRFAL